MSRAVELTLTGFMILGAPCLRAGALSQALELYRHGNCKEAKPLIERLAAREPASKLYPKLLSTCVEAKSGAPQQSLIKEREASRAPQKPKTDTSTKTSSTKPPTYAANTPRRPAAMAKPVAPTPVFNEDYPAPSPFQLGPPPQRIPPPPTAGHPVNERDLAGNDLLRAEQMIKAKRLPEAEGILEKLVADKPNLSLPRLRLAEIYSERRKFNEAATQYGWLADREGAGADPRLRQARNYSWAKNYDEAAASYQKYLVRAGNDSMAQLELAQSLFWADRLPEASVAYKQYLQWKPEDSEARLNLGRSLLWSKQYDDAADQLKLVKTTNHDVEVDLLLAKSFEYGAKPDQALTAYQNVLASQPQNEEAREAADRLGNLVLLQAGYQKQEKKDYKGALDAFNKYLAKTPDDAKILLQVGRLHAWAEEPKDAVRYYDAYLTQQPKDEIALRELAKLQTSIPDFAGARKTYAAVVNTGRPKVEDYEGLVNSHLWDAQYDSAQPWVKKLLELDPMNPTARKAQSAIYDKRRSQELERAQKLMASGKFPQALEAYQSFSGEFGATWEVELTTARLYGWNRQTPKAVQAYQEYLSRYPQDVPARLELADLERWSGKLKPAESEYQAVLKTEPKNPRALFGVAQVADVRGDDRFVVFNAYRRALSQDAGNPVARERLADIMPSVSPSIQFRTSNFHDSDDFGRQITTVETGIPFRGGLKLSPLFRHGFYNQYRQVGGGYCGTESDPENPQSPPVQNVSDSICAKRGTLHGLGGGLRVDLNPNPKFAFTGEITAMSMTTETARWTTNATAELVYHPKPRYSILVGVMHRDAIYDVNTIGSLFAGIMQDAVQISYEQPLSDRWKLWLSGGMSRYSEGEGDAFEATNQRRFSANADYQVQPGMTAGYFVRVSGFSKLSPLFFSPEFYGTTGFRYTWDKPLAPGLRTLGEVDLGYGRINRYDMDGVNTAELAMQAGIAWDIRPDLTLKLGYRYGRGQSSSFGSPVYRSGVFDFGMSNYWTPMLPPINPNRIEIR